MAQSYTRQSSFSDGDTITAALFNNEYDQLVNAFTYSSSSASNTGHRHDGTSGQGGNVPQIGDLDFLNKVVVDGTNNRVGFFVEVSSAAVEQIRVQDGAIVPVTDNDIDIGTSSLEFKDGYFDGTIYADAINFNGTAITSTAAELNILDGVTSTASELNILDGVTATAAELNILDGVTSTTAELNILDGVTASATDINLIDGITNGTVIASKAIITDSNKDISGGRNITISGELDAATLDISGDADIDGTLEADAYTVDGTTLSEYIADTVGAMVSGNTETNVTVTYDDNDNTLDFNATGTISALNNATENELVTVGATTTELDAESGLTYNGSTLAVTGDIDLSGSIDVDGTMEADAITVDSSPLNEYIADTVGAMVGSNTETGITVTYEDGDNTLDFVIGTLNQDTTGTADNITVSANNSTNETVYPIFVDGATGSQGAESDTGLTYNPSSGMLTTTGVTSTFTGNITGNVTGNASGTAATVTGAAQTNITSLGTLTALTVDNIAIDGAVIGHTSDTDLITLSSGVVTVAGEVDATSLDISGDADIDGTLEADAITVNGSTLASVIAGTTVANATLAATATVADSTANTNFPIVFHDESNGLLDDTGALRYNPSTGELLVPKLTVAGTTTTADTVTMEASNAIVFEGATADSNETTLSIVDPTSDHTQYLINQGGYIPVLAAATTTQISATPAELNIMDGVTATTSELNIMDGVTSTTAELNILDGVTASAADINLIDGITNGTVIASKAIITDANKDITGGRNITISGELDAATLDISGDADIDGTLETDALSINGTSVTSTAAELNILDGVTSTAAELNIMDGGTAASSTTLADGDRLVVNDDGTMKQVALTDFDTRDFAIVTSAPTNGTGKKTGFVWYVV